MGNFEQFGVSDTEGRPQWQQDLTAAMAEARTQRAIDLAQRGQVAHALHTSKSERHSDCEFCWDEVLQPPLKQPDLVLTADELLREHRGW